MCCESFISLQWWVTKFHMRIWWDALLSWKNLASGETKSVSVSTTIGTTVETLREPPDDDCDWWYLVAIAFVNSNVDVFVVGRAGKRRRSVQPGSKSKMQNTEKWIKKSEMTVVSRCRKSKVWSRKPNVLIRSSCMMHYTWSQHQKHPFFWLNLPIQAS